MENEAMSLKNQPKQEEISHLALDIGGTLIKMVYFSNNSNSADDEAPLSIEPKKGIQNGNMNHHVLCKSLCFQKFETEKISDCIEFLSSKKLQDSVKCCSESCGPERTFVKATGGGAFKFADLFHEKLGITLDKTDEMDCLVAGANFLLKVVQSEAFTYMEGKKEYLQIDQNDLYPYLLVNIGSGVSMIKVDGHGKFQRVSGTSVGGGTFLGLGKLLTNCKSFDELLELSHQGNNRAIDMLVGDIFGRIDYSKLGLTSSNIASSFGKAITDIRELEDYKPEDIARSLLRMISNNIGQIAYLNALRFGIKRIFFAGFFIRGHEYTMDTISIAVNFWSKGEAKAMFLRHEGFLGALGAFMSCKRDGVDDPMARELEEQLPTGSCSTKEAIRSCNVAENGSIECRVQLSN